MSRRIWARLVVATLVLAAPIAVVPSIGAAAEKVLRVNIPADPAMIDPITLSELVAEDVTRPIYEGFTRTLPDGTVEPALALSWTTAPDGRSTTFHLRPGVRFQSGRPFGAKDVKYTFEAILRPGSRGGLVAPLWARSSAPRPSARARPPASKACMSSTT